MFVMVKMAIGVVFWIGNLICFFREARKIEAKLQDQNDEKLEQRKGTGEVTCVTEPVPVRTAE